VTLLPPPVPDGDYETVNGLPMAYRADIQGCNPTTGECWIMGYANVFVVLRCPTEPYYFGGVLRQFDTVRSPGSMTCVIRLPRDDIDPKNCPITSKPVYGENGVKFLRERDYAAPGLLDYTRVWRGDRAQFYAHGSAAVVTATSDAPSCYKSYVRSQSGASEAQCFEKKPPGANEVVLVGHDGNEIRFTGATPTPLPDINLRMTRADLPDGQATYTVQTEDNTLQFFDINKRITRRTLASGAWVAYTYSDDTTPIDIAPRPNLLLRMADSGGRHLVFTYDAWGDVKTLTDPAGGVIEYFYGEAPYANCPATVPEGHCRRLTRVKYADGSVRRYHYNEAGALDPALNSASNTRAFLTGVTDELDHRLSEFRYDAMGRAASTGWGGHNALLSYGGSSTTVTDPSGASRSTSYQEVQGRKMPVSRSQPGGSGCGASASAYQYDANANVSSLADFNGARTCYAYDTSRNLETVRVEGLQGEACGSVTPEGAALPVGSRKTRTQWHPDWRLQTRIAEPGRITTRVYNGQPDPFNGNAIASCAPATALLPGGKPIAVLCKQVQQATTDTDGHLGFGAALKGGVSKRQTTWTYNQLGQVLTEDGPRTDVADITAYEYYADTTDDHTLGDLKQVTDAVGKVTRYTKYDKHGQVLESADANGTVTVHTYDLRQRLLSSSVGGRTTRYDYDAAGQLKKLTLPDDSWIGYDYDDAHRQVAVYDHKGNRTDYVLDNAGNRIGENTKDPGGALKRQLSRSIDALGRVQQTTGRE
jgi:YD repeat-containing protein